MYFISKKIDGVKNDEIRDTLVLEKLQDTLGSNRIKWLGHVMRMSEHRLPKKGKLEIKGKISIARPRTGWKIR